MDIKLYHKESWALKNSCFKTVEKTLESSLDGKEIQPVHPKGNQSWLLIWRTVAEAEIPNNLAAWGEELTRWKRPWCWERLKAGVEGDDRRWDDWVASRTWGTWIWASSGSCWWTGKPAVHGVAKSWTQLSDWTGLNWGDSEKGQTDHPWVQCLEQVSH